jgi:molybdopterin synthase sulfur carrier subunit
MAAMARVVLTPQLSRFLDLPSAEQASVRGGGTVAAALAELFDRHPRLKGYIVDEHGRLRQHVTLLIDGRTIIDRVRLGDAVEPDSELHVLQALSGG